MSVSVLKTLWLLAGLTTAGAGGHLLLSARPRQQATLARLAAVDSCLAASNQQRERTARDLLAMMAHTVAENRNQAADLAVLRYARRIRATTQALTDTLHRLRLGRPAGGTPATLARLRAQARQCADTLALLAPAEPYWRELRPTYAGAAWLREFGLGQVPALAIPAALTRLETDVRQQAELALLNQVVKVGSKFDGFAVIQAFAAPASATVAPGARYEAQLLLGTRNEGHGQQMSANGRAVPLDPRTGRGRVAFRVPPARAGQPDTVRAAWHGRIQLHEYGADTSFTLTVPYLIVKRLRP